MVTRWQGKPLGPFKQSDRQQGRQREQHSATRYGNGRLELGEHRIQPTHACCHPGVHVARPDPHWGSAVERAPLALGTHHERAGPFRQRHMQPSSTHRFRQGVAFDPQFCRHAGHRLSVVQQRLGLLQHLCRQDRRTPAPRGHIVPTDSRSLIGVTASGKIGSSSWGIGFSSKIGVTPGKKAYYPPF